MTLSDRFDDPLGVSDTLDGSVNLNSLYCSHLWTNSNLRNAILKAPHRDSNAITYCYTCKGKIRKYELKPPRTFKPHNHSTPNKLMTIETKETPVNGLHECPIDNDSNKTVCSFNRRSSTDSDATKVESKQYIPSISQQIDSSFRQKYTSYEMNANETSRRSLRKSLKGFGCIVNFASTDSPVKKRTQIRACSISVMILAIVVISFLLVNVTNSNIKGASNLISSTVVPTKTPETNLTASAINDVYTDYPLILITRTQDYFTKTTEYPSTIELSTIKEITESNSSILSVILKIRKNIRTYQKSAGKRNQNDGKPKDNIARDLSQRFCSCQMNEICMLDENSGTSVCKKSIDIDDPTAYLMVSGYWTDWTWTSTEFSKQILGFPEDSFVMPLAPTLETSPEALDKNFTLRFPQEKMYGDDSGCGGLCALETEACQLVDRARGVRVCRSLTLVTCTSDEWRCRNGLCVPTEARCDGSIQCYDRSDEMYCECDLTKQFRCGHSISCFSHTKLCDGVIDCWDGFDELNCTTECPDDQFTCTDGQCILASRFCDGLADCADNSDEPDGCGGGCGAHEIRCRNERCVPRGVHCDGHDNCGDATDELQCSE